jgi:hypothetical protein
MGRNPTRSASDTDSQLATPSAEPIDNVDVRRGLSEDVLERVQRIMAAVGLEPTRPLTVAGDFKSPVSAIPPRGRHGLASTFFMQPNPVGDKVRLCRLLPIV